MALGFFDLGIVVHIVNIVLYVVLIIAGIQVIRYLNRKLKK